MTDYRSLNHTRWTCQYHVVFIPKSHKCPSAPRGRLPGNVSDADCGYRGPVMPGGKNSFGWISVRRVAPRSSKAAERLTAPGFAGGYDYRKGASLMPTVVSRACREVPPFGQGLPCFWWIRCHVGCTPGTSPEPNSGAFARGAGNSPTWLPRVAGLKTRCYVPRTQPVSRVRCNRGPRDTGSRTSAAAPACPPYPWRRQGGTCYSGQRPGCWISQCANQLLIRSRRSTSSHGSPVRDKPWLDRG